MDTRLLEDALLLLEEGSLSRAAARRHMTQPAFSRRIRGLEDWLGQPLVVRHANRVELSPVLVESEAQIRAQVEQLEQFREELRRYGKSERKLSFAAPHAIAESIFPDIARRATTDDPAFTSRLRTRNQDQCLSMFLLHEVDVLLAYQPRELPPIPFDDSVARRVWRRDALVPVVGGTLRYRVTADLVLEAGTPTIAYPADSQFGQLIAVYERGATRRLDGLSTVESAFSLGVTQLVMAGVGAAWVPHSQIREELRRGDVTVLSQEYGRIPLDVILCAHRSNGRAMEFLERLFGEGDDDSRGSRGTG